MLVLNFLAIAGPVGSLPHSGDGAGPHGHGRRLAVHHPAVCPLFASSCKLAILARSDARLLAGAALFGLGWSLRGFVRALPQPGLG
jgi:hypothetical protein